MAQRFTVSVPDEMAEKIEKYREEISPSAIFQKAIEAEISRKENLGLLLQRERPTIDDIVQRLKKEKDEIENISYTIGFRTGIEWSASASYEELSYVITNKDTVFRNAIYEEGDGSSYSFDLYLFFSGHFKDLSSDERKMAWFAGWFDSLTNIWDQTQKEEDPPF